LIVTNTLLKEVGFASQGNVLHEVEGVGGVVVLLVAQCDQETVGDELDVLGHELGVHTKQGDRECVSQELLLNSDGFSDDVLDDLFVRAVVQVREQQASEVGVEALVTRDQLVGEGKTRHKPTLLQPEDRGERAREEDTLNGGEGYETRSKGGFLVLDPLDSPISLASNARD